MAKGDKEDVARAKAVVSKKKVRGEPYRTPQQDPYRTWKQVAKNNLRRSESVWKIPSETKAAKKQANKISVGKTTPKQMKDARVAARQGAKNKIKAQGAKSMLSPTSSALERAKAKRGNK